MHVKSPIPQQSRPASYGGATRAGPPGLQRLAEAAQTHAETSSLTTLAETARAPVQRKVKIGDTPVEQRTPEKWRLRDADKDMPSSPKDDGYYSDDWIRTFKDMAQYKAYSGKSAPVSVGLIEPYAAWYNIPYIEAGTFFVLGENHGAFGYRDLAAESNITGNVLGEGGAHALLDTPQDLQQNKGDGVLKDGGGDSREYMMESIAPKAYYSANVAVYELEKEAGVSKKPPGDGIKRGTEAASDWLLNYKFNTRGFDEVHRKPYYEEPGTGKRIFMQAETVAGPYNRFDTAQRMLNGFLKRLVVFLERNPDHEKAAAFRTLQGSITQLLTELAKDKAQRDAKETLKLARGVRAALLGVSKMEDGALNAAHEKAPPAPHQGAFQAVDKPKSYEDNEKTANFYRERAMYQAILKAKAANFAFCGIGDNHAVNLKASLEAVDVPIITLDDLIKTYSKLAR